MNDGTEYQVPTVGARSKYTLLIFASKKAMRLAGTRQYLSIIRPIMKKNPSKSYDFDGFCLVLIKKMHGLRESLVTSVEFSFHYFHVVRFDFALFIFSG